MALPKDASVIETRKINDIAPFAYIKATMSAVADDHPHSRINELLPWNFAPPSWTDFIPQRPFN